jgi:hypothetical protein
MKPGHSLLIISAIFILTVSGLLLVLKYLYQPQDIRNFASSQLTPSARVSPFDHKLLICHVPAEDYTKAQAISVDSHAWQQGHDPHRRHSLDFVIDANHPCPPLPTPTPVVCSPACDPRIPYLDTRYPNGAPGNPDCNIDLFEAILYINNYLCQFTPESSSCDYRIPESADGAYDQVADSILGIDEVVLAINNFNCSSL